MFLAAEAKRHTRLGTRLNYEQTGISSLFRQSGRKLDDLGKDLEKDLAKLDPAWKDGETWYGIFNAGQGDADTALLNTQRNRVSKLTDKSAVADVNFAPSAEMAELLPKATRAYTAWAVYTATQDGKDPATNDPW